jgi:hypothetical protein
MKETYISKTVKYGQVTITVRRPVLDDGELEKRAKQTAEQLSCSLVDYLKRQ